MRILIFGVLRPRFDVALVRDQDAYSKFAASVGVLSRVICSSKPCTLCPIALMASPDFIFDAVTAMRALGASGVGTETSRIGRFGVIAILLLMN